jgi:hypothetical protein
VKKHQTLPCHGKKSRNRHCVMSDSEIITILLCFHFGSFRRQRYNKFLD